MKKGFKDYLEKTGEVGYVTRVVHEVVEVAGLPGVNLSETVVFESGQLGQVSALENEAVDGAAVSLGVPLYAWLSKRLGRGPKG